MTLILPVGPPGCGKSTLREWFINRRVLPKRAVVSPDDLRVWLTGERADQTANNAVFSVVRTVVQERLRRNLNVYLDATNLTGLSDWLNLAAEHSQPAIIVTFKASDDTPLLMERNRTREHPVPDEVLGKMIVRWENQKYSLGSGFKCKILTDTQVREETLADPNLRMFQV